MGFATLARVDIEHSSLGTPSRIGRFSIVEPIGDDAFGSVYVGVDENERARIRLRVLPEAVHTDPARRARVIEDAKAAMQVEHPGIAALLDVGESPNGLFLVSELAPRRTLREYVAERGKLDLAEALRLAGEIASALAAAHRMGVVHGLLSDERVMIGEDGRAKIVDLGMIELMRPLAHRPVDTRTDVYSIGAMLAAMLTGTRVSTNEMSSDPPASVPRIDAAAPDAPASLVSLVERATSADPDRRPADADRLLAALTDIDLPSEPIAQQAQDTRDEVRTATGPMWIAGVSVAIALVVTLVVALVMTDG